MRFLLTAIVVSMISPHLVAQDEAAKRILVIAHRGAHQHAPENSLRAIQTAIEIGCDYVEVDVRTTTDGKLVVMHDSTVDRTTDGTGRVDRLSLAEIRKLRFGSKWPSERVPTFEEVLAACQDRIKVYIDHKDASPAEVLQLVRKYKMLSDIVVYSNFKVLREYKKLDSGVWITTPHPETIAQIEKLVIDLKPDTFNGNIPDWTAEQVRVAHDAGVQIWADNPPILDNEAGIRAAVEAGIDAIQTDHPKRVIALLKSLDLRPNVSPSQDRPESRGSERHQ